MSQCRFRMLCLLYFSFFPTIKTSDFTLFLTVLYDAEVSESLMVSIVKKKETTQDKTKKNSRAISLSAVSPSGLPNQKQRVFWFSLRKCPGN